MPIGEKAKIFVLSYSLLKSSLSTQPCQQSREGEEETEMPEKNIPSLLPSSIQFQLVCGGRTNDKEKAERKTLFSF